MARKSTDTKRKRSTISPGADLPFDNDAEQHLLCSIALDPARRIPEVLAAGLRVEHFHDIANRTIFLGIGAVWERTGNVDAFLLTEFLKDQRDIEHIGVDYLGTILSSTATASSAVYYAEIVMKKAKARRLLTQCHDLIERYHRGEETDDLLLAGFDTFAEIMRTHGNGIESVNAAKYLTTPVPDQEPIIHGLIDAGDRHYTVSQSKAGKSWYELQKALCVAAGIDFLGWHVSEPKRVCIANLELKESQYHRRLQKVADALGLTPDDIGDRLDILNLRGAKFDVFDLAKRYHLLSIDPLYPLLAQAGADENKTTEVAKVLARIAEWQRQTDTAVSVVHHAVKGRIGDKQVVDRAAGAGVMARDFDGMVTLSPQKDHPDDMIVVETVLRNYKPSDPFVVEFVAGAFQVVEDIEATAETSKSAADKTRKGPSVEDIAAKVAPTITEPTLTVPLRDQIRTDHNIGLNKADSVLKWLEDNRGFAKWKTSEKQPKSMFGPKGLKP